MANPYYNPEKFDLEIIYSHDNGEGYSYDILVVFRHKKTKDLYYATDSGCSCYPAFDNLDSISDLTDITKQSFDSFARAVEAFKSEASEAMEVLSIVAKELKAKGENT